MNFSSFVLAIGSRTHEDLKEFVSTMKTRTFEGKDATRSEKPRGDIPARVEDEPGVTGAITLTEHTFTRHVREGVTFVSFMVPWCARSKILKPIWEQLALKFVEIEAIKIAKVSCQDSEQLCNRLQVSLCVSHVKNVIIHLEFLFEA